MRFFSESQFQTDASESDEDAREGRIRTQTTTFCLDSVVDEEDVSTSFTVDALEVAAGVAASSSATVGRLVSTSVVAETADCLVAVSAATNFVKGEDLAAEPTLAFLAIVTDLEGRCSVLDGEMVERRLAVLKEGQALMVVVALEVRGQVGSVDLLGEVEGRAGVAAAFLGSDVSGVKAFAVKMGSEGSVAKQVAGEGTLETDEEEETEEWACKSERMLLLLGLEARELPEDISDEAEMVEGRPERDDLRGVGKGGAGDEVEDRKRNMMQRLARLMRVSCKVGSAADRLMLRQVGRRFWYASLATIQALTRLQQPRQLSLLDSEELGRCVELMQQSARVQGDMIWSGMIWSEDGNSGRWRERASGLRYDGRWMCQPRKRVSDAASHFVWQTVS